MFQEVLCGSTHRMYTTYDRRVPSYAGGILGYRASRDYQGSILKMTPSLGSRYTLSSLMRAPTKNISGRSMSAVVTSI